MSDNIKKTVERPQEQAPFNPFWGLDIGERWGRELGSIDARLNQLESDNREIKRNIKELDAKTDKMVYVINRLDERINAQGNDIKSTRAMIIGLYVAVVAGIGLQFFFK